MSIYEEIGIAVVNLRKQKGLTQESLALECDMSVSYLRGIEHGTENPTIKALSRIADVLDVEVRDLLAASEFAGVS